MAEPKTRANDADVDAFLATVEHEGRRADAQRVRQMMEEITSSPARMWGKNIVGFGEYTSHNDRGKASTWMLVGFSPRKANLVLYIMPGFDGSAELLERLGRHRTGKSCLYLTQLAKVDEDVLRELIAQSVAAMRAKYP